MFCLDDGKIEKMCINTKCNFALLCAKKDCPSCIKKHKLCPITKLSTLTNLLNDRVSNYRDFMLNVFEVDNLLVEELEKFKKDLTKNYYNDYMKENYKKVIE